jgi:hypothetical protein
MGTNAAVSLANIYMAVLIDPIIQEDSNVFYYKRYIDDLFIIFKGSQQDWSTLESKINKQIFKLNINFNVPTKTNAAFLDLDISLCPIRKQFVTMVYQKELNKYFYLTPNSHHVPHTFKGFIKGELTRYARLNSSPFGYNNIKQLFYQRLLKRGYSRLFLNTIFNNHKWANRDIEPFQDSRVILPFVIPYTQRVNHQLLESHFQQNRFIYDEYLDHSKSMLIYSRTRNTKDFLCTSSLTAAQKVHLSKICSDSTKLSLTVKVSDMNHHSCDNPPP